MHLPEATTWSSWEMVEALESLPSAQGYHHSGPCPAFSRPSVGGATVWLSMAKGCMSSM